MDVMYPKVVVTKVEKRDGRIVDFDIYRIEYALERAMKAVGEYNPKVLQDVINTVIDLINKRFKEGDIPHVEQIQDIIELALVKHDLYEVAKAYITYRKEKEKIREEKKALLGKFYEEEVAKRFSLNAIRLMVNRYLYKGENLELKEGPKQMFQRVAMTIVIPDILYDPVVYDKEGKQTIKPKEEFNPEEWEHKVGLGRKDNGYEVTWNKYHLERMKYLYDYLNERGHMKLTWSEFFNKLLNGEFDKYYENYKKYYDLMVSKKFMPNSPTLFNAGLRLGQLSACFVIDIDDDMESIMKAATDAAFIFKSGGGVGINYSKLRPEGDVVGSTGGIASGPVSFMKIIDTVTDVVKQGSKRRGANMGILESWHPDIFKFIHAKEVEGVLENFNISVMFTPDFWEYYEKGEKYPLLNPRVLRKYNKSFPGEPSFNKEDTPKEAVWGYADPKKILEEAAYLAWKTADPGALFMDNINRHNPQYKFRGPIRSTNPCVVGNTRVLTPMGYLKIEDLFKIEKNISADIVYTEDISKGGENFAYGTTILLPTKKQIIYTNTKGKSVYIDELEETHGYVWKVGYKPVYKIELEEGLEIETTPDHRIYTVEGWKRTDELKPGDKIILPRIDIDSIQHYGIKKYRDIELDFELGFIIGWIIGDGYVNEESINLYFNKHNEKDVLERIERYIENKFGYKPNVYERETELWLRIRKKSLVNLFRDLLKGDILPEIVYTANSEFVKGFISGLFSADGYIDNDGAIRLTSSNIELLKEIQKILLLYGIASKIYNRPYERKFKYINKEGETIEYISKGYYELIVKNYSRKIFYEKFRLIDRKYEKLRERLNKVKVDEILFTVKSVKYVGEKIVYDMTVPGEHKYITNGIISHNCGEQPLYPYESCNLGSLNLYAFVKIRNGHVSFDWDEFREAIKWAYRFLDNVIDVNKYPLKEIEEGSKAVRRVGLGYMGLADTLFALKIPYNSEEGFEFMRKIMEFITYHAMLESIERAKERGVFPKYDETFYKEGKLPIEGYYHKELWTQDWNKVVEGIRKYGIRNVEVTSIAPTGSISMLVDVSPGLEPQYALVYEKRVTAGTFYYVDVEFERQLKENGLYNEEILKKIAENGGSVQGIEDIPLELRKVFLTALDIPWWDHVRAQAVTQLWTTTSISKTINMPSWVEPEDVLKAYLFAHRSGCKGITVYREGSKSAQVYYAPAEATKNRLREVLKMVKEGIISNKTLEIMKELGIEPPSWYYTIFENNGEKIKLTLNVPVKLEYRSNLENGNNNHYVEKCPVCGSTNLVHQGGCITCLNCGWSECVIA